MNLFKVKSSHRPLSKINLNFQLISLRGWRIFNKQICKIVCTLYCATFSLGRGGVYLTDRGWWLNTTYRKTRLGGTEGRVLLGTFPLNMDKVSLEEMPSYQTKVRRYRTEGNWMYECTLHKESSSFPIKNVEPSCH